MLLTIGKFESMKVIGATHSCFLKFKYDPTVLDKVKSLPCRFYIADEKAWEIPISDIKILVKEFGENNIEVFSGNEFPEYYQVINKVQNNLVNLDIEKLKEYYRNVKPIVDFNFKTNPMGHQIDAFNIYVKQQIALITDVMGLGKTMQALNMMDYKIEVGVVDRVLIICCVNSTKYNWVAEIEKHSYNNKVQVVDGTKAKKLKSLKSCRDYTYTIINVESLRIEEIVQLLEFYFDEGIFNGVIIDEIHKCANHKSIQGKNLQRIKCKYKIGLSGTPVTKRVEKLWNILNWFGIASENYWSFYKRYCMLGGYLGKQVIGYKNLDELHERLASYQIRRTKDILDLPPKTYQYEYIDMTNEELAEYNKIQTGIVRDIESGVTEVLNPMTVALKLQQYTDTLKIKAVVDLVNEITENGGAVLVFSRFKTSLTPLLEAMHEINPLVITGDVEVLDRQAIVQEFQSSKTRNVLVGTIQAMGTGLTLTKATYVVYLNKMWTVGDNEQACDRAHRIGSTDNVTVITCVVKNTVDEGVEEVLEEDKINIDHVVDGIQSTRSNTEMMKIVMKWGK